MNSRREDDERESVGSIARVGRVRWTICAMLFAATSINYMDRQVIALLKPTLQQSIGLTELNYAYVVDAFQIAYAMGLLLAGRVVDKLGSRIGYALVMGIWSIAAMGHALASSALEFGVARFFLGIGESGNFPAAIKTVAEWFPRSERSLATGIFNSGANIGAILAPLLVPWVTVRFGWRAAFLSTGIFSALWIAWWSWNYRTPEKHADVTGSELRHIYGQAAAEMGPGIPWLRLLKLRQTWAFSVAKFLTDPIWWFYLFWLPSYFSSRFHLDLLHLGPPLMVIYTVSAVGSIGGGWLPAPFQRAGFSPTRSRFAAMLVCATLAVPIFAAGTLRSEWTAISLLSLAAGAHQGWSANLFTTASDMFPKGCVGAVVGIGGMAGSAGGALFSFFVGHVLQRTHTYTVLFFVAASMYLLALLIMRLIAPEFRTAEISA